MLTIFTCPKPFEGHIGVIQRNAIRSWRAMGPDCEVIMVAAEEDTEDVAREFGVGCAVNIDKTETGTPLLSSVFAAAEESALHDYLAYVNADIMLSSDFLDSVQRCMDHGPFMMVGERRDTDITEPVTFEDPASACAWFAEMRRRGSSAGEEAIDYFVFNKGFFADIPPFALGRTSWDNWILYYARSSGARLIDASACVTAIHQNHDYGHAREKTQEGVWRGDEAERNRALTGGHFFYLYDCNYQLTADGVEPTVSDEHIRRRMQRLKEYRPLAWNLLLNWKLRYFYCRRPACGL